MPWLPSKQSQWALDGQTHFLHGFAEGLRSFTKGTPKISWFVCGMGKWMADIYIYMCEQLNPCSGYVVWSITRSLALPSPAFQESMAESCGLFFAALGS